MEARIQNLGESGGLATTGSSKIESVSYLSPSFWKLLATLDVPWLVDASVQSLHLCSVAFSLICLSLCPNFPLLEILPFETTWMDLEGIMLSEASQTEKDKYCMISLTCEI